LLTNINSGVPWRPTTGGENDREELRIRKPINDVKTVVSESTGDHMCAEPNNNGV
jgi:hypothetical protein